tara:strand:- start:273 stop:1406 length:1134 start_codon:yes stop_codon:yes gene_type:complete
MPGNEIIGNDELNELKKIFSNGSVLFSLGFENKRNGYFAVRKFEENISKFFKSKYCVAVSSGTAAIKVALKALGVSKGDEVITQAFNFIATIEAIIDLGAKPILVNVDNNYSMSLDELKSKISKKTKVILPVHMLGYSSNMKEILNIAKKNKIKILEDNCETMGGKYKNSFLGLCGDIGVFSLDFNKTITTGEGGLIVTNKPNLYKFSKEYIDHGHINKIGISRGMDDASMIGFNYRITEMQGAVGISQLKKLKFILKENKKRFSLLEKKLVNTKNFRKIFNNTVPNYEVFIFQVGNDDKKKIIEAMKSCGFNTKVLPGALKWHCASYWKKIFSVKERKLFLKTENILNESIAIPILIGKKISDYNKLISKLNNILK